MRLLSSFEHFCYSFDIAVGFLLCLCVCQFFSNLHISAKICKNSANLPISAKICINSADLHRFAKIENLGSCIGRENFHALWLQRVSKLFYVIRRDQTCFQITNGFQLQCFDVFSSGKIFP